ncbi:four helix bundle protein [Candidatus Nomurabacteria bacterium]|nr:four helix bundle protein [Candidatus Nomurabacteria bacterium]USN94928.1 MAG: four helix bundle protein [Candidatus Nomurabacteria bacterium]
MKTYKELIVWQKSIELVEEVYKLTRAFPEHESFGLISQMRRAAVSIPSNIAEGRMRGSESEFKRFLFIAFASGAELETQIIISKKLPETSNLDYNKIDSILLEIMKILNKLTSKN